MKPMSKKELFKSGKLLGCVGDELYDKINLFEELSNDVSHLQQFFIESYINSVLGIDDYVETCGHIRHESGMFLVDRLFEIVLQDGYYSGASSKEIAKKLKTAMMCVDSEVSE